MLYKNDNLSSYLLSSKYLIISLISCDSKIFLSIFVSISRLILALPSKLFFIKLVNSFVSIFSFPDKYFNASFCIYGVMLYLGSKSCLIAEIDLLNMANCFFLSDFFLPSTSFSNSFCFSCARAIYISSLKRILNSIDASFDTWKSPLCILSKSLL